MMVDHELTSMMTPQYDFTGDSITSRERTTIVVKIGTPFLVTHCMELLIVDQWSAYHGVLSRPTLKDLLAVTCIHHQCIKVSY